MVSAYFLTFLSATTAENLLFFYSYWLKFWGVEF